jgi:hypothetical protein
MDWGAMDKSRAAFKTHELKAIKVQQETKKTLKAIDILLPHAMKTTHMTRRLQLIISECMAAKAGLQDLQSNLNWQIDYFVDKDTNEPITADSLNGHLEGIETALGGLHESTMLLRALLPKTKKNEE